MANEDVLIVGKLDDKDLRKSIDDLVNYVGNQTSVMASEFVVSMDLMRGAMKDFAVTQKVSVDLMKESWKEMSESFDAMFRAESGASGGGRGAGGGRYEDGTLGALKAQNAELEKQLNNEKINSAELERQVNLLTEQKNLVKEQTTSTASKLLNSALNKIPTSLSEAQGKLNELETIQRNYSNTTKLSVSEQNRLTRAIATTKKQIEKFNSMKPKTLKEVMGMDESSVDAIANKMRALRNVSIDPKNTIQVRELGNEYQRLSRLQSELLGRGIQMTKSNNYLAQSFGYIRNRIVYALTLGAITNFTKQVYEIRAQYELLERSLGVLVGSFEKGSEIFRELSSMAIKSPFTLLELAGAAKQLTAYNFSAKEVVDTTRRLADISAALGVPMERLVYNLGQIRAQTRLTARDARDFANAGLPIVKSLSEYYTELEGKVISTGDVYDRMSKKMVSYSDVMAVLNKMTDEGGKFFDFQAKQAETLRVQLANLTLAWNNMLNEIGESQQGLLTAPIGALKSLFANWQQLSKVLTSVVISLGAAKAAQALLNLAISKTTTETIAKIAAQEASVAADYKDVLATQNLTKVQARYLLALNPTNKALQAQIVNMRILTVEQAKAAATTQPLLNRGMKIWWGTATAAQAAGNAIKGVVASLAAMAPAIAGMLAIGAIIEVFQNMRNQAAAIEEINNTINKNAKESAESIQNTLSSLNQVFRDNGVSSASELGLQEQEKAWEMLRGEIELSTAAANAYMQVLLQEDNMGKRVDNAKKLLEHILRAHQIMATWHDDAIKIDEDFKVLGIGADGLSEDLGDFQKAINKSSAGIKDLDNLSQGVEGTFRQIVSWAYDLSDIFAYMTVGAAHPMAWLKNIADATGLDWLDPEKNKLVDAYKEAMDEVEVLSKSLQENILMDEITNQDEIKEVVSKTINSIAQEKNWSEEKTQYARLLLEKKWAEDSNVIFQNAVADKQTAWDAWLKFLTARHKTEFSKMGEEEVSSESWAQDRRKQLYENSFQKFKEYNSLAASMIEDSVNNLSQLQVHIKVFYDEQNQPSWLEQDFKKRLPNSNLNVSGYKTLTELISGEQKVLKEANEEMKRLRAAGVDETSQHFIDVRDRANQATEALDAYNAEHKKTTKKGGGKTGKKDILGEALQKEVQLITDIRKRYEEYRKIGIDADTALTKATDEYNLSLNSVKDTLSKFGITGLQGVDVANMDMRDLVKKFGEMKRLASLKGNVKGVQALEKAIASLNVEITKLDYKKITDGLNSELSKIKDEYELAVELDANPELGDMFADMFGIDTTALPKTFGEALDRAQDVVNKKLKEMKITMPFDLMKGDIDKFIESSGISKESQTVKDLQSAQKAWQDMFKKNLTSTEKFLDDYKKKYGDYSDKIAEIEADRLNQIKQLNEAYYTEQMRRLPEYLAKMNAIQQGADRQKQAAAFEQFKNSRYYTMMFENLDYISTKTIRDIRDKMVELRDSMNELTPEQLKWVTQQYEKLEQTLIKRRPFKTLVKDVKEYFKTLKDRKAANEEFRQAQKQYDKQMQIVAALKERYEQMKRNENISKIAIIAAQTELGVQEEILAKLKEQLDAAEAKINKYNLIVKLALEEVKAVSDLISSNLSSLGELRDTIETLFGSNDPTSSVLGDSINGLVDSLTKVGDAMNKITSSATSGNVVGVVSGTVGLISGIGDAIASIFGDGAARTRRINREIEKSVEFVRKLSMAYKELEKTVEKESGVDETAARRAEIANKKAQLAELERQMALEKSKRSKDRDEDAIKQYEESIQDLRLEIDDLANDVVNNLLGADAKSAAEAFVDTWVDAWRAGETTLDAINGKMDEMIYNLIKKATTSRIVQNLLKPLYEAVDEYTSESSEGGVDLTTNELKALSALAASLGVDINEALTAFYGNLESLGVITREIDNGSKNLSALQQGIQSITENTAGALEAYWNANTQQQYVQSGLLTEIRDTIAGFDLNVQLGVMTQILLQMQASYQVMQSMHALMENWTVPSGSGIRVELIS